ncbi:hypothetical protein [Sinorhizobium meliloti]|uniref:hypothetical protein n=1 Tax=Rhizobium meliloti TaxID=382 RepID=UPI000FDB862A|nr:hypothetical protein [Sinorhizobium meliloti]RVN34502.1 hypothetical protein CN118_22435 [Sinorhizobium meliloti]
MAMFVNSAPITKETPMALTLDEFMRTAGRKDQNDIYPMIRTGTYSGCHVAFFEATGIWIPELVPVFQKMDAMLVTGPEIKPQGI